MMEKIALTLMGISIAGILFGMLMIALPMIVRALK